MCLWNLAEILQFDPKLIIKYLSKTIMLSVSKLVFQSRYKAWETFQIQWVVQFVLCSQNYEKKKQGGLWTR